MAPKSKIQKDRKRKNVSLATKIQILDKLRNGVSAAATGREFELGESTVRGIKKIEDKIRKSVTAGATISLSKTSHARNPLFEKMEKLLNIWIEDKNQKNMPLNGECIRMKAKRIYNHISQEESTAANDVREFSASKGWLDNFKKRFALHNICLTGEAASADEEAAKLFIPVLSKIIEDGGYNDHQIFNADETGLNWKKMPKRTYVSKAEKRAPGFKAAKDRLSLLFCSNKSGDLMTKPLAIHKSLNPRAFKNADKEKFPVFWRANKKAWMTAVLFREWFNDMFVPEVEAYLKKKNLCFKVLLLVDNVSSHPEDLHHPNVKIVFLPPNTTSLIQPLDQGIISTFKAVMLRFTFEWLLDELDSDNNMTVPAIWKKYTMMDCLDFIRRSLQTIKQKTLAGCWKKLCPPNAVVQEDAPQIPEPAPIMEHVNRVIAVAHSIGGEGFIDMSEDEVHELIVDNVDLTEEELVDMLEDHTIEITGDPQDISQIMTLSAVSDILSSSDQLITSVVEHDDNLERSGKFVREIRNIMAPYYELKKEFDRLCEQLNDFDMYDSINIEDMQLFNTVNDEGELSPSKQQKIV